LSLFGGPPRSTPLDPDDLVGLIPTWIATQGDLNKAEQENIARAVVGFRGTRWTTKRLTQPWIKDVHHRMLEDVWEWAGDYRRRDLNIGVPWEQISVSVETLLRDVEAQIQGQSWPPDEIAIRFHHRLVWIHPFRNGNGRHARLFADFVAEMQSRPRFEWGGAVDLIHEGSGRDRYLAALRRADAQGEYDELLAFARDDDA
jgi:Fic-DOC domain mobile mystery protein B